MLRDLYVTLEVHPGIGELLVRSDDPVAIEISQVAHEYLLEIFKRVRKPGKELRIWLCPICGDDRCLSVSDVEAPDTTEKLIVEKVATCNTCVEAGKKIDRLLPGISRWIQRVSDFAMKFGRMTALYYNQKKGEQR